MIQMTKLVLVGYSHQVRLDCDRFGVPYDKFLAVFDSIDQEMVGNSLNRLFALTYYLCGMLFIGNLDIRG